VEQIVAFPAGRHDDKVDACALLGLALSRAHPAIVSEPVDERPKLDDYSFGEANVDSWKVM
jgi:hypothetical protein